MLQFDRATMITDHDAAVPHGSGIALALLIMFMSVLGMYLIA